MHLVIVGNGIAGSTAARHVRKACLSCRITMVSDEAPHPFARTALMYVYMGHLTREHTKLYEDRFWRENRIDLVHDRAERLDGAGRTLALRSGGTLAFDGLLIATGSVPALPDVPGAALGGVQGLYHLADLDRMERGAAGAAETAVIGGGLIGVELAEMLRVRGKAVTFLVREPTYLPRVFTPDESALVAAEIRRHGVDLRFGAEAAAFLPDDGGRVRAVRLADGAEVPAAFVGVGTGVRPNVAWLDGSGVETARGVRVDATLQTSLPGIYAAGDCAELAAPPDGEPPTRPIWYTARLQGATAALGLLGQPRAYAPGVFFNSAKFFDLEYQVYGRTDPRAGDGLADTAWSDGRRSLRIRHHTDGPRSVVGFSALGVRLRQDVCTRWIADGAPLDAVRARLADAWFDAEFTLPLVPTP
jgi:NADPH-dependent 2,4-dienoyl-CoA reductase/sulfur reductase-like enzyme